MRWTFFKYRETPDNLGVGTRNLALEQPQYIQPASIYNPRYMVQGSLAPQAPGLAMSGQRVVPVSLAGGGSTLHGQRALQALAELKRG